MEKVIESCESKGEKNKNSEQNAICSCGCCSSNDEEILASPIHSRPNTPKHSTESEEVKKDVVSTLSHHSKSTGITKKILPTSGNCTKIQPGSSKRKGALANIDPDSIQVIGLDFPQLASPLTSNKKYRIKLRFRIRDPNTKQYGPDKSRTISFGTRGIEDFIESRDLALKSKIRAACKSYDNPLKSNFYRVYLLNWGDPSSPDLLGTAYLAMRKRLGII